MEYSFIIAVIPVILVVAFLVWIAKKITDGERLDMKEGVLGVVILMVAVLIMVPMVSSTQVYTWDEDRGELVIQKNISGGVYAWDTYDDQIRSIVIKPGVTQIGNSAFSGAANVETINIPASVTDIGTNAFGVTFVDPFGNTIPTSEISGYNYAGFGDGVLYQSDPEIFAYSQDGTMITGLSSGTTGVLHIVLPEKNEGRTITAINTMAFNGNTTVVDLLASSGCEISQIGFRAFQGCTALESVKIPESALDIGYTNFGGCTSLTSVDLPSGLKTIADALFDGCTALEAIEIPSSVEEIKYHAFNGCTSLASVDLPSGLKILGNGAYAGCSSITSVEFPASLTDVSGYVFVTCTGVTEVTFEEGFSPTLNQHWADNWRFYASDGTTVLDKTVAANLAGKIFQGTASALVEVEAGQLALTPQQIQQVHLHDAELQDLKDQISIEPLPLQPSLQEQELTA